LWLGEVVVVVVHLSDERHVITEPSVSYLENGKVRT
jgi:hypothetical protein